MNTTAGQSGRIVQTLKEGLPILWSYVPEMPALSEQRSMPWLTVIRWPYDGTANNGMPLPNDNQQMLALDGALGKLEKPGFCIEAYRHIGAGLREFVFYIADRDKFLEAFNHQVANHPRYPIEIKFYLDENWSDLQKLINDFGDLT